MQLYFCPIRLLSGHAGQATFFSEEFHEVMKIYNCMRFYDSGVLDIPIHSTYNGSQQTAILSRLLDIQLFTVQIGDVIEALQNANNIAYPIEKRSIGKEYSWTFH